jgi:hypothetical protein
VAFLRPRLGLACALATAAFPLGNLSLGLGLAYAAAVPAWLAAATLTPGPVRRAVLTATGVVALVGLGPIDVAREESPLEAARAVAAGIPPEAWRAGLALAVAAAALTLVRTPWHAACWGGALLAAILLPNPELAAIPVVAAVWAASATLALRPAT